MKTINDFKSKWESEINKGIVIISEDEKEIIADRFVESTGEFLCERKHLNKIQADIRKLGYRRIGIGTYIK